MKPWVIAASCAIAVAQSPRVRADDTRAPNSGSAQSAGDRAGGVRAIVDQVTVEPSVLGGQRLQVTLSLVALTGQHIDLTGTTIRLVVNNSKRDTPYAVGSYGSTKSDTAIVLLLQTSLEFTEVLPVITETIDSNVLAVMSDRTQVAVLSYGEAQGAGKLQPVKTARGKITTVASDGSVGEPVLLDTVDRALTLLRKAKTEPEGRPIRKMIVIVGDGRDQAHDKDRVIRIGGRAAKENVRIHSFAYSPTDKRKPLLLLGELSKRSRGTFRWVRGARGDSWTPALQQLADEIKKQHVITYFVPADDEVSGKLRLEISGRTEVVTPEQKIPDSACGGVACEPGLYCVADVCVKPREPVKRGVLGWILLVGGIGLGAVVLLGFVGFLMSKRQETRVQLPPGMAAPIASKPAKSKPPKNQPQMVGGSPVNIAPTGAGGNPGGFAGRGGGSPGDRPVTGARLVVIGGPLQGREFAVRHGFQIGKAPTSDLVIDDGYTSTSHAQIGMDHFGNCRLYDNGSTNGTFVNGVKITEYVLEHGCSVRIGSTELRFLAQ